MQILLPRCESPKCEPGESGSEQEEKRVYRRFIIPEAEAQRFPLDKPLASVPYN